MAQQTDLAVRIATIFDEAGLKKADKAVNRLQKNTLKLGRTLGVSLGAAAVVAFGRTAVRAFNEDAIAAARLSNVVGNLGLAFEQANIDNFIAGLEKSASIADDSLRPAFQTLLTTVGSVTEAQKLLTTAIAASRGAGFDLVTVAEDLSRAYTGNTKGLQKYYLGLSKAQLASMSFEEIQAKINKTFEGANKAYLNTAAGKMEAISIATGNFAETVGGGLVDALITASGSNGVEGLVSKIDGLAQSTVNAINEFEKFAFITRYAFNPKNIFKGSSEFESALNAFTAAQQMTGVSAFNPQNNAVTGYKLDEKAAKEAKKLADMQAKLLKQSLANQKKLSAEQKKQATLKKAGSIFDLEQANLVAALKKNLTEEERKRALLQLALLTDNVSEAQRLTYEIAIAQGLGVKLANELSSLKPAANPFAAWKDFLDGIEGQIQRIAAMGNAANSANGQRIYPTTNALPVLGMGAGSSPNNAGGAINVTVNNGGSVISQSDLNDSIVKALQDASLSGLDTSIARNLANFR
jgi:hypothetical protein